MKGRKHPLFWLLKSEPEVYSIDDLARDGSTCWDGVRNYQARNYMRDEMRIGDGILFYHSNVQPTGIAGIARVSRPAYPDFTAWDKQNQHYDPKTDPENPAWMMVDIEFKEKFIHFVTLNEIKSHPDLEDIMVARRGMRLSVQPVESRHFAIISKWGRSGS